MKCPESVAMDLADGYAINLSAQRLERNTLVADVALMNGRLLDVRPVKLTRPEGRSEWAEAAAALCPFPATVLADALLQAIPHVSESLQPGPDTPLSQTDDDPRPLIDAGDPDISAMTGRIWDAIDSFNHPEHLFERGTMRVRIADTATGEIEVLEEHRMRHVICGAARLFVVRARDHQTVEELVQPTADHARLVLAARGRKLPTLAGTVRVPVCGPDGALVDQPGYHAASGLYYAPLPGLDIPAIATEPTPEMVAEARSVLRELLADFPFTDAPDHAHAVALALNPFVRPLIDGPTPLHLITAPSAGTGKSLLAGVALLPGVGIPAAETFTQQDDEMRKRLTSILMHGTSAVLFDNVGVRLDSAVLAAALTADEWTDRMLGQNRMVRLPIRCTWVATANNPSMSTEVARRSVRIRLDATLERPWERDATAFRHPDLRGWATSERGRLIWAALTLVQAWIACGRPIPAGLRPLGSFESWSRVVGGILDVAGIPGFLGNLNALYEDVDTDRDAWRMFVRAWWTAHLTDEVGTAKLFSLADDMDGLDINGKEDRARRTSLGKKLHGLRDQVFTLPDGVTVRVRIGQKEHKAQKWRLERVGAKGEGREHEERSDTGPEDSHIQSAQQIEPETFPTFPTFPDDAPGMSALAGF